MTRVSWFDLQAAPGPMDLADLVQGAAAHGSSLFRVLGCAFSRNYFRATIAKCAIKDMLAIGTMVAIPVGMNTDRRQADAVAADVQSAFGQKLHAERIGIGRGWRVYRGTDLVCISREVSRDAALSEGASKVQENR